MQSNTAEHPRRRRAAHSLQRDIHGTRQKVKNHAPRRETAHEKNTKQGAVAVPAPTGAIETRPVRVERVEAIYRMGRRGLNRTRAGRGDARGHHAETPRLRVRRSAYVIVEARGADLVERFTLLRPALDSRPKVLEVK